MNKLKATEIKDYREQQLAKQHNCCSLCGDPIAEGKAVLDHDHKTGLIRSVLHRGCNAMLGKIENAMEINDISKQRLARIAANLIHYINHSSTDLLHPTHVTTPRKKKVKKVTDSKANSVNS